MRWSAAAAALSCKHGWAGGLHILRVECWVVEVVFFVRFFCFCVPLCVGNANEGLILCRTEFFIESGWNVKRCDNRPHKYIFE